MSYFGNLVGDSFIGDPATAFVTNAADEIGARLNPAFGLSTDNVYDFDRNGQVNVNDQILARLNSAFIFRISVSGGPAASAQVEAAGPSAALAVENTGEGAAQPAAVPASDTAAPADSGIASALAGRQFPLDNEASRPQPPLRDRTPPRPLDRDRASRYFEQLALGRRPQTTPDLPDEGGDASTSVADELLAALLRRK